MYTNETEKYYYIYAPSRGWYDGKTFMDPEVTGGFWDRPAYTKKKADELMFNVYRGLPYELVHQGNQVVMANMDGWCGVHPTKKEWHHIEVDLAFATGYSIRGIGTQELVLQISTNSPISCYDVYIKGNKIERVVHHFDGYAMESMTLMIDIDNPVTRFFRITDRPADLVKGATK